MAKFETSSLIGMLATIRDEDGVAVGIGDSPHASRWDEDGLTSVRGGDGVGGTLEGLTGIDTVDGDEVDDGKLSWGGSSLTTYHFFFPFVLFPLESCDEGQGGSALPEDISIYRKIILQIINQIEYWDEWKLDN